MAADRFVALDGLRGLAAITVLILHLAMPVGDGRLFPSAYLAVDLFFMLSGFVLAHAYQERLGAGFSFGEFARARVIRLYPLYLVGLVIGASLIAALMTRDRIALDFSDALLGFALNGAMLPAPESSSTNGINPFPFNGPAWSLSWEMAANLVFAAMVLRFGARALYVTAIVGAAALLAALGHFDGLNAGAEYYTFWGGGARVTFSFFVGALLYRWRKLWKAPKVPLWVLALVLIAIFTPDLYGRERQVFDFFAVTIAFPLTILIGAASVPVGLTATIASVAGSASYPLYIIHCPLILWNDFVKHGTAWDFYTQRSWLEGGVLAGAIIALAIALDRYYDRPVRAALTQATRRTQAQPA